MSNSQPSPHKFSCIHCGDNFELFPPESGLKYAYSRPCNEQSTRAGHNLLQTIICKSCQAKSQLFWCHGHPHVAFSRRRPPYRYY